MNEQQFYRVLREVWVGPGEIVTLNRVRDDGIAALIEKGIIALYEETPTETTTGDTDVSSDDQCKKKKIEEVSENGD